MPIIMHSENQRPQSSPDGDLSLYTGFTHPRGWDRNVVRRFLDNEFKKHRVVAAILKNDPLVFTSNHAAFFAKP